MHSTRADDVEQIDLGACLPKWFDGLDALFEAHRFSGVINVDSGAEFLPIESFAGSVGGYHQPQLAPLNHGFEGLAFRCDRGCITQQLTLAGAGVLAAELTDSGHRA